MTIQISAKNWLQAFCILVLAPLSNLANSANTQTVSVLDNPVALIGQQVDIVVGYSADDSTTTGLGLRIHYDSNAVSLAHVYNLLSQDLIDGDSTPVADSSDLDGDASTDTYVDFAWASLFGNWPGSTSAELVRLRLDVSGRAPEFTNINFSSSSHPAGFSFEPANYTLEIERPKQIISVLDNPVGVKGNQTSIDIGYNTSDGNNQLPGLGFRLHYNSDIISFIEAVDILPEDLIVGAEGPFPDSQNYDDDGSTDQYISLGWASLYGNWPNVALPAKLLTINFAVSETVDTETINSTMINFSKISIAQGYVFEPVNYGLEILSATWDFDGNNEADALTDGLILLRYAFGLRGETLTNDVIAADAPLTPVQVEESINKALVIADIDNDGQVDALTDGLLLLRYLFGLEGESLVNGAVSYEGTRVSIEEIQEHLQKHMPSL